jgi:hypothetical protein
VAARTGSVCLVTEVVATERRESVHNLHTVGEHTFVVSGFVAHNFTRFRALRTWWHRLFIDPFVNRRSHRASAVTGATSAMAQEARRPTPALS